MQVVLSIKQVIIEHTQMYAYCNLTGQPTIGYKRLWPMGRHTNNPLSSGLLNRPLRSIKQWYHTASFPWNGSAFRYEQIPHLITMWHGVQLQDLTDLPNGTCYKRKRVAPRLTTNANAVVKQRFKSSGNFYQANLKICVSARMASLQGGWSVPRGHSLACHYMHHLFEVSARLHLL